MSSFLAEQREKYPEHAEQYQSFERLHSEKLWFELTEALYKFVSDEQNSRQQNFVELYTKFVCGFADDINQLRLVQICATAAQQKCPLGTVEEYQEAQRMFVDLCNTEMLVKQYNDAKEAARLKKEKQREDAAKPPAQRKRELKKQKEAEEKEAAGGKGHAEPEENPVLLVEQQKAEKLGKEALFVLQMETAIIFLRQDLRDRARLLIDHGDETISELDCADPSVHASLFRAKSQYFKQVGPAEKFFHNALRMTAYTPIDALSAQQQLAFAKELSLSAITGEGIYNFGEVVALPVFETLAGRSDCEWLLKLMNSLKSGSMQEFNSVCTDYAADIAKEPALAQNMAVLREKIALLCLMELVFLQQPEARNVSFAQVAEVTEIPSSEVETLLMRAMSVGLVKGTIDEVDQVLRVSWLKPRVLDKVQISELAKRFTTWRTTVHEASSLVKQNAAGVFA